MANEIGATEIAATRQQIVSSIVQEALAEKAQLLPLVTDLSAQAVPGMSQLSIPRRNLFSASTKSENSAVTNSEMTFGVDTITFSHEYVSAKIEDFAKVQSNVDVPAEVIKEIGEALARKVDDKILAELTQPSAANPDHRLPYADATNDDIALADITNARKLLRSNGKVMFDDDQCFGLVSPEQEEFLLQLDGIIDASKYGSALAIQRGEIGRVYGFRMIVSDLLGPSESVFFHKSAVAYASQSNYKLEFSRDLDNLADHYVGSMLCGAKSMQEGKRAVFFADGH